MRIAIEKLRRDGGTQPRSSIDLDVAYDYGDHMQGGARFPPVVAFYDGESYWLADGFHRVEGALSARITDIDCDVRQGTVADAQWFSFGANSVYGLRRSNEDKARAVKAALSHPNGAGKSDRAIAKHVGVDHVTVLSWREKMEMTGEIHQSNIRAGSDGRTINTANIGKQAPRVEPSAPVYGADECSDCGSGLIHVAGLNVAGVLCPVCDADSSVIQGPDDAPAVESVAVSPAELDLSVAMNHAWAILERESTPSEMAPFLTAQQINILSDVRLWADDLTKIYTGELQCTE